jgi:hypothetical protein
MPVHDMVVLGFIVSVFVSFGIVLAGASWYCRGADKDARRNCDSRNAFYPTSGTPITDDD